jgi:hypothetical protein
MAQTLPADSSLTVYSLWSRHTPCAACLPLLYLPLTVRTAAGGRRRCRPLPSEHGTGSGAGVVRGEEIDGLDWSDTSRACLWVWGGGGGAR